MPLELPQTVPLDAGGAPIRVGDYVAILRTLEHKFNSAQVGLRLLVTDIDAESIQLVEYLGCVTHEMPVSLSRRYLRLCEVEEPQWKTYREPGTPTGALR